MLWEHNSTIVVMLTKLREMGRVCLFFLSSCFGKLIFFWLQSTKIHVTKCNVPIENEPSRGKKQYELNERYPGMNTMKLVYEENVVAHCGILFFTPYRKNATSTGQQRGQPDTSTLWWTPWRSITCPSIS